MYSLLLAIIYVAFISLGLPDSLLGSAWPVMYAQFQVPISYAGIVTMIIAAGTIISSLLSARLTKKLGTGLLTSISVMMTAAALFGFSISKHFFMLCLWAIPYGLGAGGVDAALNNYVALHYSSKHMNWLHCFWGVGASVSPYIMSFFLLRGQSWSNGYISVAIVQIAITVALFVSLPLWNRHKIQDGIEKHKQTIKLSKAIKIKGVKFVLVSFFAYCALETTAGLWASSYLFEFRGIDAGLAARFASLYYLGITFGRFLCGFVSEKIGDKMLIRIGIISIIVGIILILLPINSIVISLSGLCIVGLGSAPVYPSIIHSTPMNFGKENSQIIIGVQMASAYLGSTFMPPLFGLVAEKINLGVYPIFLLFFAILMLVMSELVNKTVSNKSNQIPSP